MERTSMRVREGEKEREREREREEESLKYQRSLKIYSGKISTFTSLSRIKRTHHKWINNQGIGKD